MARTISRLIVALMVSAGIASGFMFYYIATFDSPFASFRNPTFVLLVVIIAIITSFLLGCMWMGGQLRQLTKGGNSHAWILGESPQEAEQLANARTNSRYIFQILAFAAGFAFIVSIIMQINDRIALSPFGHFLMLGIPAVIIPLIGAYLWGRLKQKELETIKWERQVRARLEE